MTAIQAIILGTVQGLAEMLPISSSAHLILFPWLFNFPDPGLAFDVALHLGTLFAIILYFWRDWVRIIFDLLLMLKTRKIETFGQRFAGFLVLASLPGAIFGFLLEKQAETVFRNPLIIVFSLVVMGAVLYYADKTDQGVRSLGDMKAKDSLIIGLSQAIAIIPGVSRSGITMTAGLFSGFQREDVAKFSFMMSAPIIAGAGLLQLEEIATADLNLAFWLGCLTSVISSLLAISFLLKFVKKHRFTIFVYYRFGLALLISILLIWGK